MQLPQLLQESLVQSSHLCFCAIIIKAACFNTQHTRHFYLILSNVYPLATSRHILAKSGKVLQELTSVCHPPAHLGIIILVIIIITGP